MIQKKFVETPELIDKLLLDELLVRRSESVAALANTYLRGTVLAALSTTQIAITVTLISPGWLKGVLMLWALVSGVFGLVSFWPKKRRQYTPEFMREHLQANSQNAGLSYQHYLESEYDEEQSEINRNSQLLRIGYAISLSSFFPMLAIVCLGGI